MAGGAWCCVVENIFGWEGEDTEDGSSEIEINATRWRWSPCFRFWQSGVRCARAYSETLDLALVELHSAFFAIRKCSSSVESAAIRRRSRVLVDQELRSRASLKASAQSAPSN